MEMSSELHALVDLPLGRQPSVHILLGNIEIVPQNKSVIYSKI